MAKTSTAKRKSPPASTPIKSPRTRLNKDMKVRLLDYMLSEFDARIDDSALQETFTALVARVNAILRAKYPEEDMPVLRKYGLHTTDRCLKFTILGSDRVFGVQLFPPGKVTGDIADIPCRGGCYNSEIFPCDKDFEVLADKWDKHRDERKQLIANKHTEYHAFLHACRYLEDVEGVLLISEELRRALGAQSRSLSVISQDVISRIKSDFAQGVAA